MKRTIIFGCILAVSLLLLVPSIPAVESNYVIKSSRIQFLKELREMDIDELKDILNDIDINELNEKSKTGWVPTILLTLIAFFEDIIFHGTTSIVYLAILINSILVFIYYIGLILGIFEINF